MTLYVAGAAVAVLVVALVVLTTVRVLRRRSEPVSPVPNFVVPYTPATQRPQSSPRTAPSPPAAPKAPTPAPVAATPPAPVTAPEPPAAPVSWEEEPYGTGSANPLPDGSAPSGEYTVKADADSMQYFTPDADGFAHITAEVWFRTERDAQKAGFSRSQQ